MWSTLGPMAAPKNFATGFNHNVKHKGQMYHVQTEDSGPENATLSTHLFVGGTILATLRSSYAEIVGAPDMGEQVRSQMEAQHKQMLRNLVNGQYDGMGQAVPSYQPGEIATGTLLAHGVAAHKAAPARPVPPPPPPESSASPRPVVPYADGWNHGGDPTWPRPATQARANTPILASLEPQEKQGFFGDLISEKSLDQVILAYLAGEDEEG